MDFEHSKGRGTRTLVCAGACITILLLLASLSLHNIADDSFITFRYVERFLDGKGLTWTEGEFVEGYSNALWAWVLIVAGYLGAPIPAASQLLGIAFSALTILALFVPIWSTRDDNKPGYLTASLMGGLTLSFSGIFTVWSVGGLEQPLLVALLAWLFVAAIPILDSVDQPASDSHTKGITSQRLLVVGILLSLLVAIRPDGFLYTIILSVLVFSRSLGSRFSWILPLRLAALPTLSLLALTIFRYFYYGDLVPNTAHAKLAFSTHHMTEYGIRYLYRGFGLLFPIVLVLPALLYWSIRKKWFQTRVLFLVSTVIIWSMYLLAIGGDVDPPSRHFMPILTFLAFMVSAGLALVSQHAPQLITRANTLLFALFFGLYILINAFESEVRDARASVTRFGDNNQMIITFSLLLKTAFEQFDPLMAVDGAGIPPFYTKFRSIDMLGLNDRFIALHPPATFGTGWIAHELSDPDYLMRRKPDIISQRGGIQGCRWKACLEVTKSLISHPEFIKNYVRTRLVSATEPVVDGAFWVRRDGRCGVRSIENRIEIPAIVSNSDGDIPFFIDHNSRVTGIANKARPIKIESLPLEQSRWSILVEPPHQNFKVTKSSCSILPSNREIDCANHVAEFPHTLQIEPEMSDGELVIQSILLSR